MPRRKGGSTKNSKKNIKMKHTIKVAVFAIFALLQQTHAQQVKEGKSTTKENPSKEIDAKWTSSRADGHAPIGVMGDHVHKQGEWMFSYRYMSMDMEGNLKGTDEISNSDIHEASYMVAPEQMNMKMHMLGAMFAPSDRLTLMVMTNILQNDMALRNGPMPMMAGVAFETSSEGLGDTKIGALCQLFNKNRRSVHLNFGLSIPTGSLDERGVTPMSRMNNPEGDIRLGYNMQLGSGTWDAQVGTTYLKQYKSSSFGAQASYLYRLGENSEGYTLGNKFNATFWTAHAFSKKVSSSLRLDYQNVDRIDGKDKTFMSPNMAPVFDVANSGRKQLDLLLGLNYAIFEGAFKGLRLEIEAGLPVYQKVTGIQMKNDVAFTAGIQYAIGH